jgi:peptide-methionine (S)-S-oxide reductase
MRRTVWLLSFLCLLMGLGVLCSYGKDQVGGILTAVAEPPKIKTEKIEEAVFAMGPFWRSQAAFDRVKGVLSTEVGFCGGTLKNPSYQQVLKGETGHAEAVRIVYDANVVSYLELLQVFWSSHDPTQLDGQGKDVGPQYRSIIFYMNPGQERMAQESKAALEKTEKFKKPIVTEVIPVQEFYRAEEYHQKYFEKKGK